MKHTQLIMGMPITVEIRERYISKEIFTQVFEYFHNVDEKYSPFKPTSEVCLINQSTAYQPSLEMQQIIQLCEDTKNATQGYFDAYHNGLFDPSGLVKGWAINNAAKLINKAGYNNYFIEAGGDIQVGGTWKIGIRNPFDTMTIIKVITITDFGVATSGSYERGDHVYNPVNKTKVEDIVSLTIIGPNIYEADRFATAAFAMGKSGIEFISRLPGLAAYQVDKNGHALFTSNFKNYVVAN